MYGESHAPSAAVDPYADSYPPPAPAHAAETRGPVDPPPARGRSRSRSPVSRYRSPPRRSPPPSSSYRARSPPPKRPTHAPIAPNPSNVLGVFGLSIRTQERDLEDEFSRFGRVEKVTIVYDQRSDRSRGFGFIRMATVEDATRCITELNGAELNGRRIRVDYSVTDRPHAPTPGEYMGHRRPAYDDRDRRSYGHSSHRDRPYERASYDRDRDPYGRDARDWRDRRSPPPARGGGGRYSPSPPPKRRRSYSRSPGRGSRRDYDGQDSERPAPRW
ncbi:hypothetical protein BOTBODRAFT_555164 [Botryobasidium botryosum FD-172 SS1]|uniref:RRM domain-containing protein n=1 Tax=Botryobasidium botryosum (strain FD-172 SS1) TaxID=930990 RepID=A0A067M2C3_BOTB1|nr:hypothetical protein BOTBODRAFT_555164 [Botryobasidium botryosum FD-172 SS1]